MNHIDKPPTPWFPHGLYDKFVNIGKERWEKRRKEFITPVEYKILILEIIYHLNQHQLKQLIYILLLILVIIMNYLVRLNYQKWLDNYQNFG